MRDTKPFRQCCAPMPCTVINPFDPEYTAALVAHRVQTLAESRGGACYVFVDPYGWVYVVNEDRTAAQRWLHTHADWWRGTFTARATVDDLLAELA